jgi:hypothetical protein
MATPALTAVQEYEFVVARGIAGRVRAAGVFSIDNNRRVGRARRRSVS